METRLTGHTFLYPWDSTKHICLLLGTPLKSEYKNIKDVGQQIQVWERR